MNRFTTPANLRMLPEYKWELLTEFDFNVWDDTISVPAGFVTDLASVPRIFWNVLPPYGEYAKAAIIHDYLYSTGIRTKDYADLVFLEGMKVLGVAKWRRHLMYWAVRLFGAGSYNRKALLRGQNK